MYGGQFLGAEQKIILALNGKTVRPPGFRVISPLVLRIIVVVLRNK